MQRKALSEKILCLGIDGLDPRLTRKYVDEGKMPNVKKLIERGSCRHDLVMLGGMPTVTPPMWTTLATGAYPNTHGITCFWRYSEEGLDKVKYNLDSRNCEAEQLWNVFAEAGKKTLVWHWPGSSWPPTSDSPNLHVVDGSSPGSVGMSAAQVETEILVGANTSVKEVKFVSGGVTDAVAPCVINDLDLDNPEDNEGKLTLESSTANHSISVLVMDSTEGQGGSPYIPMDKVVSPIKDATGWANAPEGAKEFTILLSGGLLRRPCLILKNDQGIYDTVAIYTSKKETEPITTIKNGEFKREVIDQAIKNDVRYTVNRNMTVLEIKEDGTQVRMWVSAAMNTELDTVWHPKSLFKTVTENIGYPPPTTMIGFQDRELINNIMLKNWYSSADWQSETLNYLIENDGYDAIFSHFHSVDLQSHMIIRYMSDKGENKLPPEEFQKFMEDVYIQADYYVGKFLHLLDKGWTILLFSDHAQVCPAHGHRLLGDIVGINVRVMQELGLTALQKDENGKDLRKIDWEHTYAIAQRANHIYLNIKGRDEHGIIDPKDQYEWEEEIMTRLYGYKDKETGKRIVALALRNRDAALLGLSGPQCGDIIYFMAEGYNYDHGESLATCWGDADTSVSPIFVAAGQGLKEGFETTRVFRQVDFAPTVAVLGGVRMPAQCEGAPAYQILTEEY